MPRVDKILRSHKEVDEFLSQFEWVGKRERSEISSKYFNPLIKGNGKIRVSVERIRANQPRIDRWIVPVQRLDS